jgi:hypothetical protein
LYIFSKSSIDSFDSVRFIFSSLFFLFVTTYKRFLVGVLIAIWVVVRISYFIIVSSILVLVRFSCWVRRLLVVDDDTRVGKIKCSFFFER